MAGPDEEGGVIREEGPGIHREGAGLRQHREAGHAVHPVRVVRDDHLAGESSHHAMVEDAGASRRGPRSIAGGSYRHWFYLAGSPIY